MCHRLLPAVLAALLAACAQSEPPSPDLKASGPDGPAATDRSADRGVRAIQLPADESPHSDPEEWYYYTGRLVDGDGAVYGFELVVFQVVVADKAIYISHHAITDLQKQSFAHAMKTSLVDQRGATQGFSFDVDGWKMSGHAGKDQLSAALPGYALELAVVAAKPPVKHYGTGWMHIGSPQPFYYYSYTRMAASGTLTVDGKVRSVTGEVWMDHQWGELGGLGKDYDGWDWFSLRFDDGAETMIFVVRGGGFSGGTHVDAAGTALPLAAQDFAITASGHQWVSPTTAGAYPQGWTIKVPALGIDVTVSPLLADQEVSDRYGWMPLYWEGLCAVTGTRNGQPAKGSAYVELTGYAK